MQTDCVPSWVPLSNFDIWFIISQPKSCRMSLIPFVHVSVWSPHKEDQKYKSALLNFRPQLHNILWNSNEFLKVCFQMSSGFQCRVLFSRDRRVQRLFHSDKFLENSEVFQHLGAKTVNFLSDLYMIMQKTFFVSSYIFLKTSLRNHLLCLAWLNAFLLMT